MGWVGVLSSESVVFGLVMSCSSLRVKEGAPGFWAMVSGNRFVGLVPFNNTLWLFFYEPWSMFFMGL